MKNNTKRLIALFLSVASLHSCIAFSADGKDLHNPNDPFLHWSGGQSVVIPLPLLEQSLPSSISREDLEERERLLRSIEQSQAGLDISQYQLELAERLRQEEILRSAISSSTSSSSSAIAKDRGEGQERTTEIRRIGLSREELLKNKRVIPVSQFVENRLSAKAKELENVGILEITPEAGVRSDRANLVSLIEKYFPSILELSLNGIKIGDRGFAALAASGIASRLERLNVAGCGIKKESFTVENLNKFKALKVLEAAHNRIVNEGFKALAESSIAPQLEALNVSKCRMTRQPFTVENLNKFAKLAIFNISGNNLGLAALEVLMNSSLPHRLQKLDVQNTGLPPNTFDLMKKAVQATSSSTSSSSSAISKRRLEGDQERIAKIRRTLLSREELLKMNKRFVPVSQLVEDRLRASAKELENVGVLVLITEPGIRLDSTNLIGLIAQYFPNILELSLNGIEIGDAGFKALAASNIASRLERLNVAGCGITGQSFTAENLDKFARLAIFDISGNNLGPDAFEVLRSSVLSRSLQILDVKNTNLPPNTLELLINAIQTTSGSASSSSSTTPSQIGDTGSTALTLGEIAPD